MNYINYNDAYNIAQSLTENGNIYGFTQNTDSHLMKNSEWGAVAYLSKSKYGLNTTDITINNISLNNSIKSVYAITGCTGNSTTNTTKTTSIENINNTLGNIANDGIYTWEQLTGTTASCTGTIYGIYDLSGGVWERTTGYVSNQNEYLSTYGKSIAYNGDILRTTSTKYTTIYPHNTTYDNTEITDAENDLTNLNIASDNNYKLNTLIYGDAIRETSTSGMHSTSWYNDSSYFPALYYPFTLRGGRLSWASGAGLFCFARPGNNDSSNAGFRVVLIVA